MRRMMVQARSHGAAGALAAVLMVAPVVGAVAQQFTFDDFELDTTEDLLDVCTVEESDVSHWEATAFCYGYFQGAAHYHRALASGPEFEPMVCPPEPLTVRQVASTFITYAQANPEYLAEPPIDTAFRALVEEWPCS